MKVSLDCENASVSEILGYLTEVTGVKVELEAAAQLRADLSKRRMSFKVAELNATSTLKLLVSNLGLDYRITKDGRILLTLPPSAPAAPVQAAIPVQGRLSGESAEELRLLRKELDDVRGQVRMLSDRLIPSWQEEGLATEELSEALRSQLRISQGLLIRQVREGSPAAKLGLKALDVVSDLGEAQLLRVLKEGGKLTVYRQGTLQILQSGRNP
jgi:hypothetical protein